MRAAFSKVDPEAAAQGSSHDGLVAVLDALVHDRESLAASVAALRDANSAAGTDAAMAQFHETRLKAANTTHQQELGACDSTIAQLTQERDAAATVAKATARAHEQTKDAAHAAEVAALRSKVNVLEGLNATGRAAIDTHRLDLEARGRDLLAATHRAESLRSATAALTDQVASVHQQLVSSEAALTATRRTVAAADADQHIKLTTDELSAALKRAATAKVAALEKQ